MLRFEKAQFRMTTYLKMFCEPPLDENDGGLIAIFRILDTTVLF